MDHDGLRLMALAEVAGSVISPGESRYRYCTPVTLYTGYVVLVHARVS